MHVRIEGKGNEIDVVYLYACNFISMNVFCTKKLAFERARTNKHKESRNKRYIYMCIHVYMCVYVCMCVVGRGWEGEGERMGCKERHRDREA